MKSAVATRRHPSGTILGSYRLGDILGEGSMGIVYAATHTRLHRQVAIKVLRSEYANTPEAHRRFFDEARAITKIAHPNLVEITDFVEQPGTDNYYVMELLEGATLAELVAAAGGLPPSRTVPIMTQVAKALEAVHREGIVHRDVKPHNIMLIERGGNTDFVKLLDFGVAQLAGSRDRPAPDASSSVVGTPRYMSPEQASGQVVDHKSDIYSFGAVLYELVTGRPPLIGTDFGDFVGKLRSVIPTPPRELENLPHEIPLRLDHLITRCLAKDPSERPARMELVADYLVALSDDHGWLVYELTAVPGTPPVVSTPEPRPAPRPRNRMWLAMVIAAIAVAGGITLWSTSRAPSPAVARAPAAELRAKVDAAITLADQRIAAGRLVGPGGDEALDHLIAARALDSMHEGVRQRLDVMARKFERLADEAVAADSLPEAAAHVQTVLVIEPANAAAAARLEDLERRVLERQRTRKN